MGELFDPNFLPSPRPPVNKPTRLAIKECWDRRSRRVPRANTQVRFRLSLILSLSHLRGEPLLAAADHAGEVELAAVRGDVLLEPRLGAAGLAAHLAARPQAHVHLVVLLRRPAAQRALQLGRLLHHLPYHVRRLQKEHRDIVKKAVIFNVGGRTYTYDVSTDQKRMMVLI